MWLEMWSESHPAAQGSLLPHPLGCLQHGHSPSCGAIRPGGGKSVFRVLCPGRKNTAAMWHKVLKRNNISWLNQRGVKNSSWCVALLCASTALDSSPGFCSVVLSPFPSQFSRAMAPGVTPSFKQVCAYTHLLSVGCSPDLDNSLLPAVLCQPPPQPAIWLVDAE